MKTTGVSCVPKFGLLDFLGHPTDQTLRPRWLCVRGMWYDLRASFTYQNRNIPCAPKQMTRTEPQFKSFHLAKVIFHCPVAEQNTCQSHLFINITPEVQCSNPHQTYQSKFSETCPSEISQEVFIVSEILLFASVIFPCSVCAVTSISQEEFNQGWFKSRTLERLNKYQIKRSIVLT